MKRFILPLMLLLFVGSIFAVESAPSAVVGYVKYDCVVGDNLVAMPMVQDISTTTEFGAQFGEDINTINIWNAEFQTWDASINYGEGFWDPEFDVATGSVLFFNADAPLTYYSIGALPSTPAQYQLVVGDNAVMVPLNKSDLTSTTFVGNSVGDGSAVNTINLWSSEFQTWDASINYGDGFWDPEFDTTIGTPMLMNSDVQIMWPDARRIVPLNKKNLDRR